MLVSGAGEKSFFLLFVYITCASLTLRRLKKCMNTEKMNLHKKKKK